MNTLGNYQTYLCKPYLPSITYKVCSKLPNIHQTIFTSHYAQNYISTCSVSRHLSSCKILSKETTSKGARFAEQAIKRPKDRQMPTLRLAFTRTQSNRR